MGGTKILRSLAVIVLSVVIGGIVNCNVSKVASSYGLMDLKVSLMAGIGATTEDITFGLMIMTFIGMISGLFTSLFLLLCSETRMFSVLNYLKMLLIAIVIGILHFLITAGMGYSKATEREGIVDEFVIKGILTDAFLGFIVGFLTGLISVLLLKFLVRNSTEYERQLSQNHTDG